MAERRGDNLMKIFQETFPNAWQDALTHLEAGAGDGIATVEFGALDERPTEMELLERSEPWRPLRSVASWVCWRLTDAPPR